MYNRNRNSIEEALKKKELIFPGGVKQDLTEVIMFEVSLKRVLLENGVRK